MTLGGPSATPSHRGPPAPPGPAAPSTATAEQPSQDDTAAVTAHVQQIWASLAPAEQVRAGQLVAALTPEERAHWVAELAGMSVPDAIARVRNVIRPHTPPSGGTS